MAKKTKIQDKGKIRGIRRRWMFNSVGVVTMILTIAVITLASSLWSFYYTETLEDLSARADSVVYSFRNYTASEYRTAAQRMVSDYEEKGKLELQFLDAAGAVLYSGNDLTAGTTPETLDALEKQETGKWIGNDPSTGERIIAASSPLVYQGKTEGVIRYVSSLSGIDRQFTFSLVVVIAICLAFFAMVYFSNLYFVRSIVEPLAGITETARLIADGSYGVQIEKKFDDEIGELTDTINDMSLKIKQSEKTQSEFISSVSHELRTPLTAISGFADSSI